MSADPASLPIVSVIVPAYNVEERLPRCLDSLLQQSLPNIEIIVVDDGSTDGTAAICARYARDHPAIVHLSQPNGGCSRARNTGLVRARGRFIGYCDADDFADPQMFERLLGAAEAATPAADMSLCRYYGGRDKPQSLASVNTLGRGVHGRDAMISEWLKPLVGLSKGQVVHGFVWCCLFRAAFLRESGIHFFGGLYMHEDAIYIMECLACAVRLSVIDDTLYHYVFAEDSLTSRYFARREIADERRIREQVAYRLRMAEIATRGDLPRRAPEIEAHCVATWLYYATCLAIMEAPSSPAGALRGIRRALDDAHIRLPGWTALRSRQLAPFRRVFLALAALGATPLLYVICRLRKPRIY